MIRSLSRLSLLAALLVAVALSGCDALEVFGSEQEASGIVESVAAASITVDATSYTVDAQTTFEDLYSTFADVHVGDQVEVSYQDQGGTLIATEVSKK